MRLYRSQIPRIAEEVIDVLALDGDIVVENEDKPDAVQDIRAIMDEYLRQEHRVVQETREMMEQRQITYDQFGRIKTQIAEQRQHPTGDDGIRWIVGQMLENFMISRYVAEVFGEDRKMRKTLMGLFRKHLIDEADLDREVRGRLKNMRPGTDKWEIEYKRVMEDIRRKRGLL